VPEGNFERRRIVRSAHTVAERAQPLEKEQTESVADAIYAARYRIDAELGRGGMGRILRARDLRIGRDVALKVLAVGFQDEQHRMRFEQEARAAGGLNHPNIVAVHDIAEHDGQPFIVTELLEGETLRQVLARGPLTPAEAMEIAQQLADGLAAAHAKGIVHRDIKPENLFLTDQGRLKILDFGIAKLMEKQHAIHTDTGAVIGTPNYMSPEQVRGQPADARSDVFAFGAVVQEMLTGAAPFARGSTVETAYAIIHDLPPPLPSSIPEQLANVVRRALQKVPQARQSDARELLRELGAAPHRLRLRERLRRPFGLLVAAFVAAAATVMVQRIGRRGSARIESIAVLPLDNRSGDANQEFLADGMTDAIIDELAHVRSLRVISRTSAMAYKGARKSLPQIAKELGVDAVMEGSVARPEGRIRLAVRLIHARGERTIWSKTYEASMRDVLTLQTDLAAAVMREMNAALTPEESDRLEQKRQVDPIAYELYMKSRFGFPGDPSCDSYEKTKALLERAVALDPEFAAAHGQLAYEWALSSWMTCVDPSIAIPKARVEAQRALKLDGSNVQAHGALTWIALLEGNGTGAVEEARRAVQLAPGSSDAWGTLEYMLVITGHFEEAIAAGRYAQQLDPVVTPKGLIVNLAWPLYYAGRYEEAIAALRRALELEPNHLYARLEIGWNLLEMDRIAESLEWAEKALAVLDPGKSCFNDTMVAAGLAAAGKREQAAALVKPWEVKAAKEYVDGYQLAVARAQLGDKDAAVRWLEMAWRQHSPQFIAFQISPIDLDKKVWLGPLKGDPRITELIKRPRAP
jgi:eukaryotic-like serine/threonine-protein kinase